MLGMHTPGVQILWIQCNFWKKIDQLIAFWHLGVNLNDPQCVNYVRNTSHSRFTFGRCEQSLTLGIAVFKFDHRWVFYYQPVFRPPRPPTYKGHEAILVEINISCSINRWCFPKIIQHTFLFAPFLVNCSNDLLSQSFPQPGSEFISANEFLRKKFADINDKKTSQILDIWFFTAPNSIVQTAGK